MDISLGGDVLPVPIGRGAIKGQRLDSSLGKIGKQGKVLFK